MTQQPRSVSIAFVFMLLDALIWLTFGLIVALGAHPALPDVPLVRWSMAVLSLAVVGALLGLSTSLRRRNRVTYVLAVALLAVLSLVTLFDDFGLVDLAVLAVTVFPLALLLKDRAWYLQAPQEGGQGR